MYLHTNLQLYSWFYAWGEQVALLRAIYPLTVHLGKLHYLLLCGVFTSITTQFGVQGREELLNIMSEM